MTEEPTTVEALRARIEEARSALADMLQAVDDAEMEVREGQSWRIADHLSHLAAWERGIAAYLRGKSRTKGMGLTDAAWDMSLDEMNEALHRQLAHQSAAQARQALRDAQQQLDAALAGLSDEDLGRDYGALLPEGHSSPYTDRNVVNIIAGNTYEHYEEHMASIRNKLSREQ